MGPCIDTLLFRGIDTTQTRTRVAVSTLTVWVVYVAFFYLDLFTSEQIATMEKGGIVSMWILYGTFAVLIFLIHTPLILFLYWSGLDCPYNWTQHLIYSFFFYVTLFTISFFSPFTDYKFRELKRAEDGLIGDRPYSISCMNSTTPSKLTLPANHSYFTLEDPEWTVDWSRRKNHEKKATSYTVAPIVYNGPVVGCQFDPPLWAVCVVQGSSMEACGFNESKIGAHTSMRRFHSIHYMDTEEKDQLKKVGDADYMVEFNSPTMAEVMGIVSQIKEEKARMWLFSLLSFAGSTFLLVIYANCHYAGEVRKAKNATCSVPSSEDYEMQAADPLLESYIAPPPPEILWEQARRDPNARHEPPVVVPTQQLPQPARGNSSAPQWQQEQWDPNQSTPPHRAVPNFRPGRNNSDIEWRCHMDDQVQSI